MGHLLPLLLWSFLSLHLLCCFCINSCWPNTGFPQLFLNVSYPFSHIYHLFLFLSYTLRGWVQCLSWLFKILAICLSLYVILSSACQGIPIRGQLFVFILKFSSCNYCCHCSVAQLCLTVCNAVDYSTPGFPVLHRLLEFAQTHAHRVSDAIQPSHPLSLPSPPAFNLSQHQGLFQ